MRSTRVILVGVATLAMYSVYIVFWRAAKCEA